MSHSLNAQMLPVLCEIALAAGSEIMEVYRDGGHAWHKEDNSPLTEADLRADRVIRTGLEQHFPSTFILSEESVSAGPRTVNQFFLVDPLDGTKEFIQRNDEFTVNIAWVCNGHPVVGVVFCPALNELFYAAQGVGAFKRNARGEINTLCLAHNALSQPDGPNTLIRVLGSRSHGGEELQTWLARLSQPYTFVPAGSSLKFCRIAEGTADIYPRFGPTNQWDTAAAQAVLEIAGGAVTDLQGRKLGYGLDKPLRNPPFVAMGQLGLYEQYFNKSYAS